MHNTQVSLQGQVYEKERTAIVSGPSLEIQTLTLGAEEVIGQSSKTAFSTIMTAKMTLKSKNHFLKSSKLSCELIASQATVRNAVIILVL